MEVVEKSNIKAVSPMMKTGREIYENLLARNLDPKALSVSDRRLTVLYMISKNINKTDVLPADIQRIFGVSHGVALTDIKFCRNKISEYAGVSDVMNYINGFITRKMTDRQRALESGQVELASNIDNELFDRLTRLGFLGNAKEPHPIHASEINVTNYNLMNERELNERLNQAIERAREYQQLEAGNGSSQ
jgi:hypothetical protein